MKKNIVIGFLGTTLDTGSTEDRWKRWRPTIDLCRHAELQVHRLELIYQKRFAKLAEQVAADIVKVSPGTQVQLQNIEMDNPWDFQTVYAGLHDFARRYAFNPDKEEYLVHITTGTHVAQICLFLLTEARYLPAKLIQTAPPRGEGKASSKPGTFDIIDLDLSRYDAIASRFLKEKHESVSFLKSGIETKNKAFNTLIERIERVSVASKAPLLLMGPTGSGKSLLARRIYELKKARRQVAGPFVEVNCATLRGDAAMAALFGHTKGAFTGAVQARPGLLRAADGGMLFLDEIGELGLDEQAMLLRALEEKTFLPVGSDKEVASDFQLLAGTNRELAKEVAAGEFREDLFARINLWTFCLPPLRERREDIEPNIEFELEHFAGREGVNVTFNKEARQQFLAFATSAQAYWTGNFRDLSGSINRMATLAIAAGGRISPDLVDAEITHLTSLWQQIRGSAGDGDACAPGGNGLVEAILPARVLHDLDPFDRVQLEEVLRVCSQSATLSEAGRVLFAASRKHKKVANDADRLRKYLARFDLTWQDVAKHAGA